MTSSTTRAWAQGGTIFGAVMMLLIGTFGVLEGIAAIVKDQFFVVAPNYVYKVDTTAWGWVHLIIGALAVVAGLFIFTGATWARAVGIALASLSAVANFFFVPYYPLWALLLIGLDVFVIWSLAKVSLRSEYLDDAYGGQYSSGQGGGRWPANEEAGGRSWSERNAQGPEGTAAPTDAPARRQTGST
jgi:hypothetical protein